MRAPLLAVLVLLAPGLFAQNTSQSNDWATPAEQSNYRTTPDYDATMAYLRRIAAAKPQQVRIEPFGKTGEGRELDIVIASKDGVFDPEKLHAAKRPIVLVQNAIHAGEMDGKDSCLALLRDMVITGKDAAPARSRGLRLHPDVQRRWTRAPLALQPDQPERSGADGLAWQRG